MNILLLVFFSISFPLFSCSDINLYQIKPNIVENFEVSNQGNINTCYAHSIATVYNINNVIDPKDSLHPHWITYLHKKKYLHWKPRDLNYSIISWAYYDLQRHGYCPVAQIKENFKKIKMGVEYSDDQLIFLLMEYFKEIGEIKNSNIINKLLAKFNKKKNNFDIAWKKEDLEKILKNINTKYRGDNLFTFLKLNIFSHCDKKKHSLLSQDIHNLGRGWQSNQKVSLQIDEVLQQHKALSVGYCYRQIIPKDHNQIIPDINTYPRVARALNSACAPHYSVIMGSRKKENSCQYLIQNSFGKKWWVRENPIECYCINKLFNKQFPCSKSELNRETKKEVEVLACWIDQNKLLNNSYEFSHF